VPAFAVIDNRIAVVMEDEVTARASVILPAPENLFEFLSQSNLACVAVLRDSPWDANGIGLQVRPAQFPNFI
jgi:hypothetical protein